jgi:chemotaxis protein CheX
MSVYADAVVLPLPKIISLPAAKQLTTDLLAARGKAVMLDAAGVQRVGGLGLQVLLSARRTWAKDGIAFAVVNPTALFRQCVVQLGASELAGETA